MPHWMSLSLMAVASSVAVGTAGVTHGVYKDHHVARECYMPNEDVAALTFLHKSKRPRSISFSIKGQFSAVYLSYFTDVAIDWPRIIAIHTTPYQKDPSLVYFAVDFKPDTKIQPSPFEFGLVEKACIRRLEQRYGKYLKFLEHK